MINFRNRFTSEFLFSCHCVSETRIQTTCCLHIVFRPLSKRLKQCWAVPAISECSEPSNTAPVRSRSRAFHGLCGCVATVPRVRFISLECDFVFRVHHAATDNKFFCNSATVVFANVFPRGPLKTQYLSPMSSTGLPVQSHMAFFGPRSLGQSLAVSGEVTVTSASESTPDVTVLK